MHIVIGGAGEVGRKIAEFLRNDGHDIVLLDKEPEACDRASNQLDCLVVEGHAASSADLKRAGIGKADVFYAVTSQDEVNLTAAAIAKSHGAKRVFARVNSLDLMSTAESKEFRPIGVDIAVSPDLVAAAKIVRLIELPGFLEIDAFEASGLRVVEARVDPGSSAAGRRVSELDLPKAANLVALFRGAEVIIPRGDSVIHHGDHVILVAGEEGVMDGLRRVFGIAAAVREERGPPENIVIAGRSGIAKHVARMLQRDGRRVTLIAQAGHHEEIEQLAADMEGILVLEGSSRDVRVFREEGLDEADVVIAASPHEEFNLITALLARSMGVPRVAALVNQPELEDLAERLGIDVAVSPRMAAVSTLLKYASGLDPEELTFLHHGEAQVLVVEAEEGNKITGMMLRDAKMPQGSVVGALIREGEAIVPRGDERIRDGDSLVVFATAKAVPDLSELF